MREKLIELINESGACFYCFPMGDLGEEQAGKIADHLIQNGVTIQKWIPVTERLPERGQEVIVYTGNILSPVVMAYQFWCKDYDTWIHVTHWMPLPEPPKEETP